MKKTLLDYDDLKSDCEDILDEYGVSGTAYTLAKSCLKLLAEREAICAVIIAANESLPFLLVNNTLLGCKLASALDQLEKYWRSE